MHSNWNFKIIHWALRLYSPFLWYQREKQLHQSQSSTFLFAVALYTDNKIGGKKMLEKCQDQLHCPEINDGHLQHNYWLNLPTDVNKISWCYSRCLKMTKPAVIDISLMYKIGPLSYIVDDDFVWFIQWKSWKCDFFFYYKDVFWWWWRAFTAANW